MTRSLPSSYATGNQVPTSIVVPEWRTNEVLDCLDLLGEAGLEFMDWQALMLEGWLGIGADGAWSSKTCVNSTPRQNGKTFDIKGRSAWELLIYGGIHPYGGNVIYTSQLQKTSTEMFEECANLFDSQKLRKFLKPNGIRTALGREEIRLKNGGRMKFLARTRNGGDGQHGSLLVFDEAQALDQQAQESFLPAISACKTPRGAQTIYNGTPPKEGDYGLIFEKLRNDALDGKTKHTAYTEWSAGYGGRVPDASDRGLWRRTNPSLGILIAEGVVENEFETMAPETFAHQRLGWWTGQRAAQTLIGEEEWQALEADAPDTWDKLAYGVKLSNDGAIATLSVAIMVGDRAHVEFIRQEPLAGGIGWLVEWLMEPRRMEAMAAVAIDGRTGADDLARRLIARGMSRNAVMLSNAAFAANAAAMMVNSIADGIVTHHPDITLDASATKSLRRKIGSAGAFGFGGEHPEPVESAALALYAVRTTKRDPTRKAVLL